MSTRANILIQELGRTVWVYHHYDGYMSYLGGALMEILSKTGKYARAVDIANTLFHNENDNGFELTADRHGDIEYLYHINVDSKEITAYKTHFDAFTPDNKIVSAHWDNPDEIKEWFDNCKGD